MLIVISVSTIKDNQMVTTSERRHVVYNAKDRRRLGIWNSRLPNGINSYGNGFAILGICPGSTRNMHSHIDTEVQKLDNSPKSEAHVGRRSLGEMLM